MQVAAILGEGTAGLVDKPDPTPIENWALVKVHVAPMCTEYKEFAAGKQSECLGHEAAGEVVAVAQPGRVSVGDRVVVMPQYPCGECDLCLAGEYIHCENNHDFDAFTGSDAGRATMAQYLLKPDWLLPRIPDGVSYEHASLACCGLGPSFGAFDNMAVDALDTVLIAGLGPVGLGGVINARYRGARVIGVEPNAYRADLARGLGAEAVLDPNDGNCVARVKDMTGGKGAGKAPDCTGVSAAQRLLVDSARRRGHVAIVGGGGELTLRDWPDLVPRGLIVQGSWHYNRARCSSVMRVIRGSPGIDRLITHVFPMSEIQKAFELQVTGQCGKVLLKPWE